MSSRASPRGNPKLGPEAWCDIYLLPSPRRLTAELTNVVAQAVLYITSLVKSLLHQLLDPLLCGRPYDRGKTHIPLRGDFVVGRQAGHVDEALCFADRTFVERCDAGCEGLDKRIKLSIRE